MRRIILSSLIITAIATYFLSYHGVQNFEDAATKTALHYQMRTTCPLSSDALNTDMGLVSICSEFGLKAYIASRDNPEVAGNLYAIYGGLPDFHTVVEKHGSEALAIIQYFRERDSKEFRARARMKQIFERLLSGENNIDSPPLKLTPDDHGFIAIQELKRRGHNLLAEFEFKDGARRKQAKRLVNAATELFTGGITDLEAAMIRGEKVTWKQVAHAALDATVIIGGVSIVAKTLKGAKVAHKGAGIAKIGSAFGTVKTVVKTVATVGAVSTAALVAYNPSLMISAAGWIGEMITGYAWVGVAVLAMIVASAIMTILEFLYRLLDWLILRPMRHTYRVGQWMQVAYAKRKARRAELRSSENAQPQ